MTVIPEHVLETLHTLEKAGFEAYIIGGSVRDILLNRVPKDWDVATNALPDQILELFPDSVYENSFGTVGVKYRFPEDVTEIIEVTTYRTESGYDDHRRPEEVEFVSTLDQDLARRDFTVNALAMDSTGKVTDRVGGVADLEGRLLQTVGDPVERF